MRTAEDYYRDRNAVNYALALMRDDVETFAAGWPLDQAVDVSAEKWQVKPRRLRRLVLLRQRLGTADKELRYGR